MSATGFNEEVKNPGYFQSTLRDSVTKPQNSPVKGDWDERIGYPISTYNESVFPQYRLGFDEI